MRVVNGAMYREAAGRWSPRPLGWLGPAHVRAPRRRQSRQGEAGPCRSPQARSWALGVKTPRYRWRWRCGGGMSMVPLSSNPGR